METFVMVLHVFLCLFMIAVVLLQAGKSDMGSGFGGGGSQAVLTPASGTTLLGKITTVVAAMFMITSITLAWFSNSRLRGESVIQDDVLNELDKPVEKAPAPEAPPMDEAAPAGDDAAPAPDAAQPDAPAPDAGAGDEAPAGE